MRQRLAVGNWKMHGSLPENQALLDKVAVAADGLSRAIAAGLCPVSLSGAGPVGIGRVESGLGRPERQPTSQRSVYR